MGLLESPAQVWLSAAERRQPILSQPTIQFENQSVIESQVMSHRLEGKAFNLSYGTWLGFIPKVHVMQGGAIRATVVALTKKRAHKRAMRLIPHGATVNIFSTFTPN